MMTRNSCQLDLQDYPTNPSRPLVMQLEMWVPCQFVFIFITCLFCSLVQALYLTIRLHTQAGIWLWLATNTTFVKRGTMFMEYTTCYSFYVIKNVFNTPCWIAGTLISWDSLLFNKVGHKMVETFMFQMVKVLV